MLNRRKVLIGLGGTIALAGCTGDDSEEPDQEEESEEETSTESEEEETEEETEEEEQETEEEEQATEDEEANQEEEEEQLSIFSLSGISPKDEIFVQGKTIEVSVDIKNRGNVEGTKKITTEFAGEIVNTKEYTIEPNEEEIHIINIDTSKIGPDEYDLRIHSEDDEITSTIEIRSTNENIMEIFDLQLEVFGLNLADHSIEEDDLHIHYETTSTEPNEIVHDIMNVEEVYYSAILQGIPTKQLIAEMSEPGEEPVGRFRIENEWAIAYSDDEISESELKNKILDTLEQL